MTRSRKNDVCWHRDSNNTTAKALSVVHLLNLLDLGNWFLLMIYGLNYPKHQNFRRLTDGQEDVKDTVNSYMLIVLERTSNNIHDYASTIPFLSSCNIWCRLKCTNLPHEQHIDHA